MGLADLHLHTIHSFDGTATVPAVLRQAHKNGLDVIAITDHDEISGALEALKLAPHYGVDVIPGSEITTAEGDLLALFITQKVPAGLPLIETVLKVREQGGLCIAPHPMAGGMGMKSLSALSLIKALNHPEVADTLIGIEVYNATAFDRVSNHYALLFALQLGISQTGSSDAHVLEAIGLGATEFPGKTSADFRSALRNGRTKVHQLKEWSTARVIGSWLTQYAGSIPSRIAMSAR